MLDDGSSPTPGKSSRELTARVSPLVGIIDAEQATGAELRSWLEQAGYRVLEHASRERVMPNGGEPPAVAFVDLGRGELGDIERIQRLRARDADLSIVVLIPEQSTASALEATRAGADDFVPKPLDRDRVLVAVHRACERRELIASVRRLETALGERSVLGSIVGQSVKMRELAKHVERVVASDVAVCLVGESGTGKELVARALHAGGPRRRANFVAFNCAGIPESILEEELFGSERGDFSSTDLCRGSFEQANGGTLLLEEVGELTLASQAKLLRALETKSVRRLGGTTSIPFDVRIVCATRRDLRAEVEAGRFREDLFRKLYVYAITLPALRERSEDVPLLVGHFARLIAAEVGREIERITPEALDALSRYRWPGNVRELRSVVQRSLLASRSDEIALSDLPAEIRSAAVQSSAAAPRVAADAQRDEEILPLRELEKRAIQRALRATKGSVGKAAKLLGIGRATLYRRIATLDLSQDVA